MRRGAIAQPLQPTSSTPDMQLSRQARCSSAAAPSRSSSGQRAWPAQRGCRRRPHISRQATEQEQQQQQQDADAPSTSAPAPPGAQPGLLNPSDTIVWGGRLPNKRRAVVGGATALAIALGGNLGGISSWLLSLDGGATAARLHLDVLVPVLGFKRCLDVGNGYEFQYPASWLADQTLVYRAAQRAEAARSLDPPSLRQARRQQVTEPSAAFGPPGSTGEENVSVIVAPIYAGFRLESLGSPADAAAKFLDSIVAPPQSGKTAALVAAGQRVDGSVRYYTFEFTVSSPAFSRHNVAVLAARSDFLYTFNAQCPATRWDADGAALRAAAASFRLLPAAAASYPGSLQ